jgi:hypothetical protein
MCDLWKDTTEESVPQGSVPRQVAAALGGWDPPPEQVKLYNSGSFFDPGAIDPGDYGEIARLVSFASNVVVESHPRLAGERAVRLRDLLGGSLEVAMGLETAHPAALAKLNKGFGLEEFRKACGFLRSEGIAVRAFLLVHPPFVERGEAHAWAVRSAQFAYDCGAGAVALIPTRDGNGAMEALRSSGDFHPPTLADLEAAHSAVLELRGGRAFADTWGLEAFSSCAACVQERILRLRRMNCSQAGEPGASCPRCGCA